MGGILMKKIYKKLLSKSIEKVVLERYEIINLNYCPFSFSNMEKYFLSSQQTHRKSTQLIQQP